MLNFKNWSVVNIFLGWNYIFYHCDTVNFNNGSSLNLKCVLESLSDNCFNGSENATMIIVNRGEQDILIYSEDRKSAIMLIFNEVHDISGQ